MVALVSFNETVILFTSYISKDRYESIIGVYSFKGDYGIEKFYVEKGKFFADTLNGTTLDIKVKYDFSLMVLPFNNEKTTVLSFYVPGPDGTIVAQILLYFSGYGQLYCFNTPYVIEDIQTVHGIYTLDNNVIYVYENKMSINGKTYDITSSKKDGDNINFVLDKYENKTKYKDDDTKKLQYQKEKNKFNGIYGMTVTNTIRDDVEYNDELGEWFESELSNDDIIEKLEGEEKKSFLSFSWRCLVYRMGA